MSISHTACSDPIVIVASCDDNYAQHLGVVFLSVLANTAAPNNIHFYLIDSQISSVNKARLLSLVEKKGAELTFVLANEQYFKGFPTLRYGMAAYQRLAVAHYLPNDIKRLIYLDADIVVLDDIKTLWETELNGYGLAAVENLSPKACRHFGFKRQDYFNSGVLLIDLEQWRRHDILTKTRDFILDNQTRLRFIDQCTLNALFSGRWVKLPLRWNQQADIFGVLKKYADGCGYSRAELREAIATPSIVHYIGTQKPWRLNCFHPYQGHYHFYLAQTPWASTPFIPDNLKSRIARFFSLRKRFKQWRRYSTLVQKTIQVLDK